MTEKISIAIVDDQLLFRKGMMAILAQAKDLIVIMEAGDGNELLSLLKDTSGLPDVLLLDLEMPGMNGVETIGHIQRDYPSIKTIVLSVHNEATFVARMVELGASGYLQKNTDPDKVLQTIRNIYRNGFFMDETMLAAMRKGLQQPRRQISFGVSTTLTNREKEVLECICNELTTPEIAKKLFISERTVEGHRNNLLSKTGCRNTAGLVLYAVRNFSFGSSMLS